MFRRTRFPWMHIPGWRQQVSTQDLRTREKRDEDRKRRQLEKLPKPEILWSPQYEFKKSVLCDAWFQPVVYEDELDTPRLFHHPQHTPSHFFLQTDLPTLLQPQYPPIPTEDEQPIDLRSMPWSAWETSRERIVAKEYLRKHGILPTIWPGISATREVHAAVQLHGSLDTRESFWHAAHFGNFVEVGRMQRPPSIRLHVPPSTEETLYTLFLVSPDYPARARPEDGFTLHYVVSNISPQDPSGTVVLPYVPPLPTEDAGAFRYLYVLYEQKHRVRWGSGASEPQPPTFEEKKTAADANITLWNSRRQYQLHRTPSCFYERSAKERHALLAPFLRPVEEAIGTIYPAAIRFVHSVWDLEVASWYQRYGIPEPSYIGDDVRAEVLRNGHASSRQKLRAARYAPNGARLREKAVSYYLPDFSHTTVPGWSRRTRLPEQGLPHVSPHRYRY